MHALANLRPTGRHGRDFWLAPLVVAGLLTVLAQPSFADACNPPSTWPLGHHSFQFRHEGGKLVTSRGWDPAFQEADNADKAALVAGVPTYPVGLPGSSEPANLPRRWTLDGDVTPQKLADAGFPTIALSGVSGPIYLIDGYNGDGHELVLDDGVKVAISRSAFAEIRIPTNTGYAWVVDSLLDQNADQTSFRIFGQDGIAVYVMYSEVLGGDDAGGKGRHVAFYRSHLHGADKAGSEHADGVQINGGNAAIVYESNVDFLFRQTNGSVYISNQNNVTNVDVVNNLISGGGNAIKGAGDGSKGGTYSNTLLCGNRFLGTNGNTSWATDNVGKSIPIGNFPPGFLDKGIENNKTLNGLTSGSDHLDRDFSFPATEPVAAADKTRLNALAAKMETWVSQIRAASGSPSPPPPAPATAAPFLLP